MLSTTITWITDETSQQILAGQFGTIYIKNIGETTVTISGTDPAVANEGYPLSAWATWVFDVRTNWVVGLKLQAIANSGTGSLSILAI